MEYYTIYRHPATGRDAILCLLCNAVSHNENDVAHRYCGRCKLFLDDLPPAGATSPEDDRP